MDDGHPTKCCEICRDEKDQAVRNYEELLDAFLAFRERAWQTARRMERSSRDRWRSISERPIKSKLILFRDTKEIRIPGDPKAQFERKYALGWWDGVRYIVHHRVGGIHIEVDESGADFQWMYCHDIH